jgi:hypothetical protein
MCLKAVEVLQPQETTHAAHLPALQCGRRGERAWCKRESAVIVRGVAAAACYIF